MPAMAVTAATLLGMAGGVGCPPAHAKGRAFLPAPILAKNPLLGLQNRHDLVGVRIHDHDLLLDADELETAPFRIDRYDSLRQRMEGHLARYAGADRNRDVHIRRLNALLLDHAGDLGALLGRELRGRAGLARRACALGGARGSALTLDVHAVLLALSLLVTALGRALIAALSRALITLGRALITALISLGRALAGRLPTRTALLFGLHVLAAFATFGLHVLAAFATFGLHVLAAFAAFSLHVLAALGGVVLGAHALRLLTWRVLVFGALVLGRARGLVFRLRGLHALVGTLGLRGAIAIHLTCRRRSAFGRRRALLRRRT